MRSAFCQTCFDVIPAHKYRVSTRIHRFMQDGKPIPIEQEVAVCNYCNTDLLVEEIERENLERIKEGLGLNKKEEVTT